jgi:hypothetical protein
MSQRDLKLFAKELFQKHLNKVCKVIDLFPEGKNWNENHIRYAIKKIIECPTKAPEQIVKEIKRSYLEYGNKWFVDGGK